MNITGVGRRPLITRAIVNTSHGQVYLSKLCRHFARRVPATINRNQGRIEFDFGPCRIDVNDTQMHFVVELEDDSQVCKAEEIIENHLLQFAGHHRPGVIWHRDGTPAA